MSRGLGSVQKDILRHLEAASDNSMSFERLRWALWEEERSDTIDWEQATVPPTTYRFPQSAYTKFYRALQGLSERSRGFVKITDRPLESFDEVVGHFPFKTLSVRQRWLRQRLLPSLAREISGGHKARYTPANNEDFILARLTGEESENFRRQWRDLRTQLVRSLTRTNFETQTDVLMFVCRGMSLFESHSLTCASSFCELAERCRDSVPVSCASAIANLVEGLFPASDRRSLQVRSVLHSYVDFNSRGRYRLKQATVDLLSRDCPDIVRQLPGFRAASRANVGRPIGLLAPEWNEAHSDELYHLIDQSVLIDFRFISLA